MINRSIPQFIPRTLVGYFCPAIPWCYLLLYISVFLLMLYSVIYIYIYLYTYICIYIKFDSYIYVWKINQTVLELDCRAVKFLFFPRRDLNPHHTLQHHSLSPTSSALYYSITSTPLYIYIYYQCSFWCYHLSNTINIYYVCILFACYYIHCLLVWWCLTPLAAIFHLLYTC